jgi:hypothetical protein
LASSYSAELAVKRFFKRFLDFSLAASLEVIAQRFRGFFEFFKRFPGGVMDHGMGNAECGLKRRVFKPGVVCLTKTQMAAALQVCPRTITEMMRRGEITQVSPIGGVSPITNQLAIA